MRATLAALVCALVMAAGAAMAAKPFDPFAEMGVNGRPGATLPLDMPLRDSEGRAVTLGNYLDRTPIILAPVYYTCPNLCGVTLAGLFNALPAVPLEPGGDYRVVALSIDPRETPADAAEARTRALSRLGERGTATAPAVHFLTGSEDSVRAITEAIGFDYAWDPAKRQYAHAAAVAVVAADGTLARWLFGIDYQPTDLRLALTDAGNGSVGGLDDRLLLLCYGYDPAKGQYTGAVRRILWAAGGATVLGLGGFILSSLVRERRDRGNGHGGDDA